MTEDDIEAVERDAKSAALFFATVMAEGVPLVAAIQLSVAWVTGMLASTPSVEFGIIDMDDGPPEPWQG